jgi:hypothetical protein
MADCSIITYLHFSFRMSQSLKCASSSAVVYCIVRAKNDGALPKYVLPVVHCLPTRASPM